MKRVFISKSKAQQLIEFAIVVPILMMILFIVIEMGTALNARATLGEGVKSALVKVNQLSLDGDRTAKIASVQSFIRDEVIKYLIQHNIPNSGSVSVIVKAVNDHAVALVNYEYNPHFLVPGLLGQGPSVINFGSSQSLNPHVFQSNVFSGSPLTTVGLSRFHTDGSGNFLESGALVNPDPYTYVDSGGTTYTTSASGYDIRDESNSAILLHFYGGIGTHPNFEYDYARLVNWQGKELLPPNLRIKLKTGTLEVRSPYYNAPNWFDTRIPYIWAVSALGINHLFYVKQNSYEMLLEDDSQLYYKFRFNTTDPFYNRNIRLCGTTGSSGLCDGDHRGTATVNERALRMNPRLGSAITTSDPGSGDNSYVYGSMEPILIPGSLSHDFYFVKPYFAFNDGDTDAAYLNWNSTNWQNNYFVTIHSPYVEGLDSAVMANAIYDQDINDDSKNPFFNLYEYRLRLCDNNDGGHSDCSGVAGGAFFDLATPSEDIYIDMDSYSVPEVFYVIDIVDVYIDSDGDGIPDAWDRDPAYFDANVNGILDGNEITAMAAENNCNDNFSNPYKYNADPVGCGDFPDIIVDGDTIGTHTVDVIADMSSYEASPGKPFYRTAPYSVDGSFHSTEPGTVVPQIQDMSEWYVYDPPTAGKALYFKVGSTYYRTHPSWFDHNKLGCSEPPSDTSSNDCVRKRRDLKEDFIHGSAIPAGAPADIELDPSDELVHLKSNVFSPGKKAYRNTPDPW